MAEVAIQMLKVSSPKSILGSLHQKCSDTLAISLAPEYESILGQSFAFLTDLEIWSKVLSNHPESILYKNAEHEYAISILNLSYGQYRNAFKSIRLVLELCLQGVYLSAYSVFLNEWLLGKIDTVWSTLVDENDGPLSARFVRAFFPDITDHSANYRSIARTVYRELSETIHGNIPICIPLPTSLVFDKETFLLFHEKSRIIRLVIIFALSSRYLMSLSESDKQVVQDTILDQLSHIEEIRVAFGGVTS